MMKTHEHKLVRHPCRRGGGSMKTDKYPTSHIASLKESYMTTQQTKPELVAAAASIHSPRTEICVTETEGEATDWQGCCKLAVSLHRSEQIAEFKIDLQAGQSRR